MGDGANLKRIIDEKKTNVSRLAYATGIPPTTLYSIISKDGNLRLDFAILIAEELEIDVEEICNYNGYHIPDSLDEKTVGPEAFRQIVVRYYNIIIGPVIELYGPDKMWIIDELLRSFYQLDDIARKDTIKLIKCMHEYHTDQGRKAELDEFKKRKYRWKEVKGGL